MPPRSTPRSALRTVPRAYRLADMLGLFLVAAGMLCYARAFVGMQRLQFAKPLAKLTPGMNLFAAMAEFSGYARLAYVGLGITAAGVAVGMGSAYLLRRGRRRAAAASAAAPAAPPSGAPLAA